MLRAICVGVLGLASIGCAGETFAESKGEPVCGWAVFALVSMDEDAGDCEWSVRSLDTSVARLRSIAGEPSGEVPLCELSTFESIEHLRPRDVVEVWSPSDADADISGLSVQECR